MLRESSGPTGQPPTDAPNPGAKYKVLVDFSDLEDGGKVYAAGDSYPRDGYVPTRERIAILKGDGNALGKPIISE